MDGSPTVARISQQLSAEGVSKIAIVTDDPKKYTKKDIFPINSLIYDRKDLGKVQVEFSKINSTTANNL